MKKRMMVLAAMMLLAGCAGNGRYAAQTQNHSTPNFQNMPGTVPVHIANPDLLSQEVCLFEGSTSVTVIPDVRNKGWKYSRPAFACYQVSGANSENNWYEYSQIYLPRNFNFVVASRLNGIWGKGKPNFQFYRTGDNPYAQTYTSITPAQRQVNCGALVQLQRQPTSVQAMNIITVDIDFRPLGAAITRGLTEAVYGR